MRLTACEFNLHTDDIYVNLTNHAIQKNATHRPDDCMLDYDTFMKWFSKAHGKDKFEQVLRQMYGQMMVATTAGNDYTERVMNTFTMLGWDFMVDEGMNVWLIECNRGPDLSASTPITAKYTTHMFKDLATLFAD